VESPGVAEEAVHLAEEEEAVLTDPSKVITPSGNNSLKKRQALPVSSLLKYSTS